MRTRAPVVSGASSLLPLDLHVLGLPLAFILSQDQTLHRCFVNIRPNEVLISPGPDSRFNSLYIMTGSLQSHIKFYVSLILVPLEQVLTRSRFLSPQYFNELPSTQSKISRFLPLVYPRSFPKRLQIYNCFLTRQLL